MRVIGRQLNGKLPAVIDKREQARNESLMILYPVKRGV